MSAPAAASSSSSKAVSTQAAVAEADAKKKALQEEEIKKATTTTTITKDEARLWHGYTMAESYPLEKLPAPKETFHSDELARKGYTSITRSEFQDSDDVLDLKADMLIKMFTQAKSAALYIGAGIDVSCGTPCYATSAAHQPMAKVPCTELSPSPAHRVLAAMFKSGKFQFAEGRMALVQNHSCFMERSGVPHTRVNNVHGVNVRANGVAGVLGREENPVVKMTGSLREDLCGDMFKLEQIADFVFAVGTSFSGMNADRLPTSCAKRHLESGKKNGVGIAVITIQKTPVDEMCALRIFSDIDAFMMRVAMKLKLADMDFTVDYDFPTGRPVKPKRGLTPHAVAAQQQVTALRRELGLPALQPRATTFPSTRSPANRSPANRSPTSG